MDDVLPNEPPYNVRFGNKVTINFGNPIDLSDTIAFIKKSKVDEIEARRLINNRIQDELFVSVLMFFLPCFRYLDNKIV
jgi:hypothetical protein